MKFILLLISCFLASLLQGQNQQVFELEANYFYGSILRHNKDISSLITGHPEGIILSYNRKTYGLKEWAQLYNYPDWGFTFAYQDLKNENLGQTYNALAHYNFYFLNRKVIFRIAQGIGYTTNPFDIVSNVENNAYGSTFFSATLFMLNYKQVITPSLSLQSGLTFLHGSNGNLRAPNTSTNTLAFNIGAIYRDTPSPDYSTGIVSNKYTEPIHLNFKISVGANESDYIGLGREPFLILSAYLDKRINKKSSLQVGTEFFLSKFLKNEIEFLSIAFPQFGVEANQDWKRAGIFMGHELHINKNSLITQAGYYYYYPYDFEGRFYQRVGLKRMFGDRIFANVAVKTHGAKAEAIEFGIGTRL